MLAVFAAALAVRLLHLWQMAGTPYFSVLMGDARGYDQWARRLAAGDWIGTDVFYQAPLYPYFLGVVYAVFGADPGTARLVQAVIGSASAALLAVSAARLFGARAGLIAGLALALYAPAIFLDSLLQKSVLDVFFVAGIITALTFVLTGDDRRRTWALAGLAAGALALTRENALVLVAVIAAWIAIAAPVARAGRARALAFFLAGVGVALAPVAARNFAVSGEVYLTTSQFGPNFYIGNNAGADGSYQSLRFGRGSPEFERIDATELAERAAGRTLTPAEVSSYWTGRATAFIREQPGAWLALMARKAALLVNAREAIDTESQESYAEWSWPLGLLGVATHFGVLVPLAVFGVWATWPDRRRLAVFGAMAIALAASTIAFYVFARYRYPLVPLLVLFAAAGLAALPRVLTTTPRPRLIAAALVTLAVAAVCQAPLLSPTRSRAITETNLGTPTATAWHCATTTPTCTTTSPTRCSPWAGPTRRRRICARRPSVRRTPLGCRTTSASRSSRRASSPRRPWPSSGRRSSIRPRRRPGATWATCGRCVAMTLARSRRSRRRRRSPPPMPSRTTTSASSCSSGIATPRR
jgi:4-amino-4-deoxy-L-arabinose transferase-like glycosyltransferase